MQLRDFITETLSQIAEGVEGARDRVMKAGGMINPIVVRETGLGGKPFKTPFLTDEKNRHLVKFDVAVTVTERSGKKGGGEIEVLNLVSLGGSGSKETAREGSTRIQFSLPMWLPNTELDDD